MADARKPKPPGSDLMADLFPQSPRRGRPAAVAPDATSAGHAAFDRAGFADARLVLDWTAIAGADIARLCVPRKLSDGVLTLKAEPGAAVFLRYETHRLVERINTYLGRDAVSRLKFVQAPLQHPAAPPPRRQMPETLAEDDPAQKFAGPEALRDAVMALARARRSRTRV